MILKGTRPYDIGVPATDLLVYHCDKKNSHLKLL